MFYFSPHQPMKKLVVLIFIIIGFVFSIDVKDEKVISKKIFYDFNFRRIRTQLDPEGVLLEEEIRRIEARWAEERATGRYITRPYSAEDVAKERYADPQPEYNVQKQMALKLYKLLRQYQEKKEAIVTMGGFDEVSADALARSGMLALYRGGWDASMRLGWPDLARYPYNYVAETIARISSFLQNHARAQAVERANMTPQQRQETPRVDFMMPVIADMDTGHGYPAEMAKLMLGQTYFGDPNLIGAVHIEDQAVGCKKCGHLAGKVLTSTQAMIDRMNKLRFQLDVMALPTLIIARTDAEEAEYITDYSDPRDQPFILGATQATEHSLAETLEDARKKHLPAEEIEKIQEEWKQEARVMTLAEAIAEGIRQANAQGIEAAISPEEWLSFAADKSFREIEARAQELGIDIIWDSRNWDRRNPEKINVLFDLNSASIPEGDHRYYLIRSGLEMAIARSKAFLPYADISWMEQKRPDHEQIAEWAAALDAEAKRLGMPYAPLKGMNISPSFNWGKYFQELIEEKGMSEEQVEQLALSFYNIIAQAGVQFQFNTYGLGQIIHDSVLAFLEEWKRDQALAWAKFQERARARENPFVSNSQRFAGVTWISSRDAAGLGRQIIASPLGTRTTMAQFQQEEVVEIVAIQPDLFPDDRLEKAIRAAIGKPRGFLRIEDLRAITELDLSSYNIESLQGIQYLQNLNKLNLSHNQISDLSPLANLRILEVLNIDYNQVSDLSPLTNLHLLKDFSAANNKITDASVLAGLSHLQDVNLSGNQLGNQGIAVLAEIKTLKRLDISNNGISRISAFENHPELEVLIANHNQISDTSALGTIKTLRGVSLNNNQIQTLSPNFANLQNLEYLDLAENQLNDAGVTPIASLRNLKVLNLNQNQISNLDFLENLTQLTALGLHGNQISEITPLQYLTNLQVLYLGENQISNITPLAGINHLFWLDLSENQVTDIKILLETAGLLEKNDVLDLRGNPLSEEAKQDAEALKARGLDVWL